MIDPIALQLGPISVHWYGIIMATAIVAAAWLGTAEARRRGENPEIGWSMLLWTIAGGVIGARLYHVIHQWDFYSANPSLIPQVWNGGLGIPGAVAGGALLGASDPNAQNGFGMDRLKSTALGGGLGYVGGKLGKWGADAIASRTQRMAVRAKQMAPEVKVIENGILKHGLVGNPASMKPTLVNRILAGFAGKEALEQEAMLINGPKMQDAARKYLGIAEDVPITESTFKRLHADANKAREAIRSAPDMVFDSRYKRAYRDIASGGGQAERSFPGAGHPGVRRAMRPYDPAQPGPGQQLRTFKATDAIDAIADLRARAKEAFSNRKSGLGRALSKTSKELEDLVERNLDRQGASGKQMLARFRAGRVSDAKAYAIERVANKATGNLAGAKLAKELSKGTPLTGEMKELAEFAMRFPSETRESLRAPGVNALTTLFATESALLGHPEGAIITPLRYGLAKFMSSPRFQKASIPKFRVKAKIPRAFRGAAILPGRGIGRLAQGITMNRYQPSDDDEGT